MALQHSDLPNDKELCAFSCVCVPGDVAHLKRCPFRGHDSHLLRLNAIWGIACQNAEYPGAIYDLKQRFSATNGGRGAICANSFWLFRCDFAFVSEEGRLVCANCSEFFLRIIHACLNFWWVCSQFWPSGFPILIHEALLIDIHEEIPHFASWDPPPPLMGAWN